MSESDENPVAVVEEPITYTAQIPNTKLEVDGDWPRGTILNISLSLRVRGRAEAEDRKGNTSLNHLLVIEEAAISSVLTPAQRQAAIEQIEAARKATEEKIIAEEPGHEDQEQAIGKPLAEGEEMHGIEHPADGTWSPEISNEDGPEELVNTLSPGQEPETQDEAAEWADVEARDAERAEQVKVESVERVETDADQFEEVDF